MRKGQGERRVEGRPEWQGGEPREGTKENGKSGLSVYIRQGAESLTKEGVVDKTISAL